MLNLSKFLEEPTFEAEERLQERLLVNKVILVAGKRSYATTPGCSASNVLPTDLVHEKFDKINWSQYDKTELSFYPQIGRELSTRESIARFVNKFCFKNQLDHIVTPDSLVVVPGLTSANDLVAQVIFDEGDAMITPAPYYYRYLNDFADRGLIHIIGVPTIFGESTTPTLNVEVFEEKLQETQKQGINVKALLLVNPTNPEGGYYTRNELKPIVEWAVKHDLFIVLDEIFDLTIYDPLPNEPYQSVLLLIKELEFSYNKVIWLWGLTKNFSLPGLRVGVIHTTNEDVRNCIKRFLMNKHPNSPTQFLVRSLLDDHAWVKKFISENHRRLKEARENVLDILDKYQIPYIFPRAAFFVMLNLSKFLEEPTFEAEERLQERLLANKVILVAGKRSYATTPGWFRLVFCYGHREEVEEGLKRIVRTLGLDDE
uniref:Aminotransferase class I/classII domain-containing protein n=1 Tax=Acrobeloides nanus TaxID=290746 RepID=A0A914EMD1_9BILA